MTDDPAKKRLGRGLAALIGDMDQPVQTKAAATVAQPVADRYVPIELIGRNPANPRRVLTLNPLRLASPNAKSTKDRALAEPPRVSISSSAKRLSAVLTKLTFAAESPSRRA